MTETWTAPPAPPTPPAPRRRLLHLAALGTAGALGLGVGVGIGVATLVPSRTVVGTASPQLQPPAADVAPWRNGGNGGNGRFGGPWNAPGSGNGGTSSGATSSATAAQEVGVVDVDTILGYQHAEAAGTGMILSSDGEVLTNNHVVSGATSISVTVVSTGTTYTATVVGTDPTDDVAVLHLDGASGLATIKADTAPATIGEAVTAVGNAGGNGGTPIAAPGQVTALDRTITATDEDGGNAEQLTGLIQTDADVQPGDSGGPLYDSSGRVIGMDTAASSGGAVQGYAIPIGTAESVAKQIENGGGTRPTTPQSGSRAFLGVEVQDGAYGAAIVGVLPGGAAGQAGLAAGDVITRVGAQQIGSADDLSAALAQYSPGQRVRITWTDPNGSTRSATVVLGAAPID